jgi:hypothetical protein
MRVVVPWQSPTFWPRLSIRCVGGISNSTTTDACMQNSSDVAIEFIEVEFEVKFELFFKRKRESVYKGLKPSFLPVP